MKHEVDRFCQKSGQFSDVSDVYVGMSKIAIKSMNRLAADN
jgi:hypothetical protein